MHMQKLVSFLHRFGLTLLEITMGVSFLWFGALLLNDGTPLQPFIHAAFPGLPVSQLMMWMGMLEVLIGVGLLTPLVAMPTHIERGVVTVSLALELFYIVVLVGLLFFSSGNIFSPVFPLVSAFGYFLLYKLIALIASVVASANRMPA